LHLKDVDAEEHERIAQTGRMTFHAVGCSGDYGNHQPEEAVAAGMAAQVADATAGKAPASAATRPSFLYHLGDVIYKPGATSDAGLDETYESPLLEGADDDPGRMYNDQFYVPFRVYDRPIMAIAGNHDGKYSKHPDRSAVDHFLSNFCAKSRVKSADNAGNDRTSMIEPYIYWRLNTPVAHFVGLYSNIANGGILDDPSGPEPGPQYQWLVSQLRDIGRINAKGHSRKALVLAVHYPPYSGATNFAKRGDPRLGPTNAANARPLGEVLQQAFVDSGQRPDMVVSAHAHLYQRLTYTYADGWQLPLLVAGCGGHAPIEKLFAACDGTVQPPRTVPFDAVLPGDTELPEGDSAQVVAFNDRSFGFLRVTIGPKLITSEFLTATAHGIACVDSFTLDFKDHRLLAP
jgi:hypothetical protein